MPLIGEPFFPWPRDNHGFVRFGIILSLSAVHQWAQDTLFLGPLQPPERWKSRNRPAAGMEQIDRPSKGDPISPRALGREVRFWGGSLYLGCGAPKSRLQRGQAPPPSPRRNTCRRRPIAARPAGRRWSRQRAE